ncbi:helix-turn-helix domain-containing protein [Photorhabdus luminescens]|uniref:Insertion element IS150 protein InsJ-like helix-turn-helix domain-containing protein n=1 Tax=Photorhabdus luminescens subsp. mexicana TaxID=2100167 RepID=A0A4R4J356_PHOLU|nr:helix-turn-helix domain-containing protein [Photorhabdus luminescens]TDB47928.1 hypothetical protein C5468_17800 [Photorhabdus luminescens subsp. mexicana]
MKLKYPFEFKLKVVKHYLPSNDGMKRTDNLFGIGRTAIRRWITIYQHHGVDSLESGVA